MRDPRRHRTHRFTAPDRLPDIRIATMAMLVLEAHQLAVAEANGSTVDILTDALEHLQDRIERELLPNLMD